MRCCISLENCEEPIIQKILYLSFIKVLSERLSEIQSNQLTTESHYYTQILGLQEMNETLCKVGYYIKSYKISFKMVMVMVMVISGSKSHCERDSESHCEN